MWKAKTTPTKISMTGMAERGDRFELLRSVFTNVPLGTRLISDVAKMGPAQALKCEMATEEWDRRQMICATEL